MGGKGSGNWYRIDKKSTVEESFTLSMRDFRGRIYPHASGTFTCTWTGGIKSSVGYFVTGSDDGPIITLQYRWNNSEDVQIPISLQTTPTQFGGRRWWFTCPLIKHGMACNRRSGKLYLPPRARYFGCRKCNDLTYQSCQEAHQTERLFAGLGFDPDIGKLLEKRLYQRG